MYTVIAKINRSSNNTPKRITKPSPKNNNSLQNTDAKFKEFSQHTDSLIKEEQTRTKIFTGIRGLYTNMWRLTKSLTQLWKQEATLDMDSNIVGKNSFADFLFTSPKLPQMENTHSPLNVVDFTATAGTMVESQLKDKENWGSISQDPSQEFRRSSINDRALRNLDKGAIINTEESDRTSKGKLTPVNDLLRNTTHQMGSKSPSLIQGGQNFNRETSRTTFSARENPNQQITARDKSLVFDKTGLMRHSSKFHDEFGATSDHDHRGENASPKDGSFSAIHRRESGHTNDILKGYSYISSFRDTKHHEQNKPCPNCATKEGILKYAQDEMLKAQREKLTLEMELGRMRAEIIGIQKHAENEIFKARSESIQRASIQDQEKEEYSTALILLSEICNHNSAKLDEIRLRMLSLMEQNIADSSHPMKWLVKMQNSTVEELIKANTEIQEKTKSLVTDFQSILKEKTPRDTTLLYSVRDLPTKRDSHPKILESQNHLPEETHAPLPSARELFKVDPIEIQRSIIKESLTELVQNPTPTLNVVNTENDDRDSF